MPFARRLAGLAWLLAAASACADEIAPEGPAFLTLILENDNYAPARQDRHYTNGAYLSYGFPRGYRSPWLDWLGALVPLGDAAAGREYDVALGQHIYTPEAFASPRAIADDRPFAGWLYGEMAATAHAPGIEERLAIALGVVGPLAAGERSQRLIHAISGDSRPQGWRNQLKNEPALSLRYRRSYFTALTPRRGAGWALDLVSRFGLTMGNVVTEAGAGAAIRLGSTLFERDLPQRLQPGLAGISTRFDARDGRFDWFLFADLQGRAVARNLLLDGNSFADSLSVDRKPLLWEAGTGLCLVFGHLSRPVMVTMSLVWRSREFDGQRGGDRFGSAQIAVQL